VKVRLRRLWRVSQSASETERQRDRQTAEHRQRTDTERVSSTRDRETGRQRGLEELMKGKGFKGFSVFCSCPSLYLLPIPPIGPPTNLHTL
jgi:hypothetical protein